MAIATGLPQENGRSRAIDALRGMSVLAVLATHCALPPGMFWPLSTPQLAFSVTAPYGVVVFVVISGFLIARDTLCQYGD